MALTHPYSHTCSPLADRFAPFGNSCCDVRDKDCSTCGVSCIKIFSSRGFQYFRNGMLLWKNEYILWHVTPSHFASCLLYCSMSVHKTTRCLFRGCRLYCVPLYQYRFIMILRLLFRLLPTASNISVKSKLWCLTTSLAVSWLFNMSTSGLESLAVLLCIPPLYYRSSAISLIYKSTFQQLVRRRYEYFVWRRVWIAATHLHNWSQIGEWSAPAWV